MNSNNTNNYNYQTINAKPTTKSRFDDLRGNSSHDEFLMDLMDVYEGQQSLERELYRATAEMNRLLEEIQDSEGVTARDDA